MDELIPYALLLIIKQLLWLVELFTDFLFGYTLTRGSKKEREEARSYDKCAHLVNIKWRALALDITAYSLKNFLYVHERYIDPRYTLQHVHVTLFTAEKDCVVFCVSDPQVNIYDTVTHPWVFFSHYHVARKLIIIPLDMFNRLADELGDPKVDVSLVHMTTRCGSTLISQMMNRVPNTRSMSEPWAMTRLAELFNKGSYSWEAYKKLVHNFMRLHCKIEPDCGIQRIVFRLGPMMSVQLEILHEVLPNITMIFNTRHPRPSILSLMKVVRLIETTLYARTGLMWNHFASLLTVPYKEKYLEASRSLQKWIKPMSYEEVFTHIYASSFASFLEAKHIYSHVVTYENLMADLDGEVEMIFKKMNVPVEFKAEALEALERDSQNRKFGERGERIQLDDGLWRKMDSIFDKFHTGLTRNMSMAEFEELLKLPEKTT